MSLHCMIIIIMVIIIMGMKEMMIGISIPLKGTNKYFLGEDAGCVQVIKLMMRTIVLNQHISAVDPGQWC